MSHEGIALLGKCGLIVPAVTIRPSSNFVRAKLLASASVSNVLVDRGLRRRTNVAPLGTSKVTYQVCFIFDPEGSRHHPLPAVASPFAYRPLLVSVIRAATADQQLTFSPPELTRRVRRQAQANQAKGEPLDLSQRVRRPAASRLRTGERRETKRVQCQEMRRLQIC